MSNVMTGYAMNHLDTTHLLNRFRLRGDHGAFQELYNLYAMRIRGVIQARGVSHAAAADVFQEICISLANHLANKEVPAQHLERTVFTITKNRVADSFRGRQDKHVSMDVLLEEGTDFPAPDQAGVTLERRDLAEKSIEAAGLNKGQKESLLLHYIMGYPFKDIAKLTSVPVATVKTRIYTSKKAIREVTLRRQARVPTAMPV